MTRATPTWLRRSGMWAIVVVVAASVVIDARPAQACSCALPPDDREVIAGAPIAFTGRQVDRLEGDLQVKLLIEVEDVYRGAIDDVVELRTGRGDGDCGTDLAGYGLVGLVPQVSGGELSVSICSGVVDPRVMAYEFEPLPVPTGTGPPAFVTGVGVGGQRLALLDSSGRVLRYGSGDGRTAGFATCPGGRYGVEVVEPPGAEWTVGGEFPPHLATRDLESMEVIDERTIELEEREPTWGNGHLWVTDVQCHAEDGSAVSYLVTSTVWARRSESEVTGPADLHVWDGPEVAVHDAGVARSAQVSVDRGVAWLITGRNGSGFTTLELAGGTVVSESTLPGRLVAWKTSWSPRSGTMAILARRAKHDPRNGYWAEVDSVITYEPGSDGFTVHPLPEAGIAVAVDQVGGGVVATVGVAETERTDLVVFTLDGKDVAMVARVPVSHWSVPVAARPGTVLAMVPDGSSSSLHATVDGVTTLVKGVHRGVVLDVFGDRATPRPAKATPGASADTDLSDTPDDAGTASGSVVEGDFADGPPWIWIALLSVLGVVGGAAALARARRRRSTEAG